MPRDDVKRPKWDILAEVPSLAGKVAIVTGANSSRGIGFHIAKALAAKGAKVYVGARSIEKAESAIEELKQWADRSLLHPFVLNLAEARHIQEVTRSFLAQESRLDILVNNAGLLARPLDKNEHGISVSIATNHIGPFQLTRELLPLLERTAKTNPGISSTVHALVPSGLKLEKVEDFNQDFGGVDDMQSNLTRYGFSKLANILFTKELQRQLDEKGAEVIAITLHPGGVKTDGAINFLGGNEDNPLLNSSLTPEEGALTALFAAAHPSVWKERQKYAGAYLMPYAEVEEVSDNGRDIRLAQDLWKVTEEAIRETSP